MKLLKSTIFLFLIAVIGGITSCNKCEENYSFHRDYILQFFITDDLTGDNLLEIAVNRYYPDTVQIYDENMEPLGIHPDTDGSMVLYITENAPDEPLSTDIEHTYYVYFEQGDYDTLKIAYRIIQLERCDYKTLYQWSASYNDSLYFDYSGNPPMVRSISFAK